MSVKSSSTARGPPTGEAVYIAVEDAEVFNRRSMVAVRNGIVTGPASGGRSPARSVAPSTVGESNRSIIGSELQRDDNRKREGRQSQGVVKFKGEIFTKILVEDQHCFINSRNGTTRTGEKTDLRVTCQDGHFFVHKAVIPSQSTLFQYLLQGQTNEDITELIVSEYKIGSVKAVFSVFYFGWIPLLNEDKIYTDQIEELCQLFGINNLERSELTQNEIKTENKLTGFSYVGSSTNGLVSEIRCPNPATERGSTVQLEVLVQSNMTTASSPGQTPASSSTAVDLSSTVLEVADADIDADPPFQPPPPKQGPHFSGGSDRSDTSDHSTVKKTNAPKIPSFLELTKVPRPAKPHIKVTRKIPHKRIPEYDERHTSKRSHIEIENEDDNSNAASIVSNASSASSRSQQELNQRTTSAVTKKRRMSSGVSSSDSSENRPNQSSSATTHANSNPKSVQTNTSVQSDEPTSSKSVSESSTASTSSSTNTQISGENSLLHLVKVPLPPKPSAVTRKFPRAANMIPESQAPKRPKNLPKSVGPKPMNGRVKKGVPPSRPNTNSKDANSSVKPNRCKPGPKVMKSFVQLNSNEIQEQVDPLTTTEGIKSKTTEPALVDESTLAIASALASVKSLLSDMIQTPESSYHARATSETSRVEVPNLVNPNPAEEMDMDDTEDNPSETEAVPAETIPKEASPPENIVDVIGDRSEGDNCAEDITNGRSGLEKPPEVEVEEEIDKEVEVTRVPESDNEDDSNLPDRNTDHVSDSNLEEGEIPDGNGYDEASAIEGYMAELISDSPNPDPDDAVTTNQNLIAETENQKALDDAGTADVNSGTDLNKTNTTSAELDEDQNRDKKTVSSNTTTDTGTENAKKDSPTTNKKSSSSSESDSDSSSESEDDCTVHEIDDDDEVEVIDLRSQVQSGEDTDVEVVDITLSDDDEPVIVVPIEKNTSTAEKVTTAAGSSNSPGQTVTANKSQLMRDGDKENGKSGSESLEKSSRASLQTEIIDSDSNVGSTTTLEEETEDDESPSRPASQLSACIQTNQTLDNDTHELNETQNKDSEKDPLREDYETISSTSEFPDIEDLDTSIDLDELHNHLFGAEAEDSTNPETNHASVETEAPPGDLDKSAKGDNSQVLKPGSEDTDKSKDDGICSVATPQGSQDVTNAEETIDKDKTLGYSEDVANNANVQISMNEEQGDVEDIGSGRKDGGSVMEGAGAPQGDIQDVESVREDSDGESVVDGAPKGDIEDVDSVREESDGESVVDGAPQGDIEDVDSVREESDGESVVDGAPQGGIEDVDSVREDSDGGSVVDGAPQGDIEDVDSVRAEDSDNESVYQDAEQGDSQVVDDGSDRESMGDDARRGDLEDAHSGNGESMEVDARPPDADGVGKGSDGDSLGKDAPPGDSEDVADGDNGEGGENDAPPDSDDDADNGNRQGGANDAPPEEAENVAANNAQRAANGRQPRISRNGAANHNDAREQNYAARRAEDGAVYCRDCRMYFGEAAFQRHLCFG